MRVWPALPVPELVRLPLPCPPQLIELAGYTPRWAAGRAVVLAVWG